MHKDNVDFGIIEHSNKSFGQRLNKRKTHCYKRAKFLAEILKRSPAVWPSSGRYLMYATFDDRRVGEYKYPVYMKGNQRRDEDTESRHRQPKQQRKKKRRRRNLKFDPAANTREYDTSEYYLYPKIRTIRYPKVSTAYNICVEPVKMLIVQNLDFYAIAKLFYKLP